ncbi:hypothetical protein EYM_07895 [Ignicoccus islandicus DSM 13165]|uniref:Uncharacterized protein n=1 Tax=Ignicoccus islandicus DSM 13165 TaxID=940295 RepID=A0A0U3EBX4_9CREN|nr:hypothetical protein [Ignicoccus islandicus]ALU12830.1 hypothetical protein EYM_07895 [Ignicoccus islandicus DSM 13165]
MTPTGSSFQHEVEIQREADTLSHEHVCIDSALVNAVILAYQKVLYKVLGSSAIAYTQILISELGDLLSKLLESKLINNLEESLDGHDGTLGPSLTNILKKLGVAKEAKVVKESDKEIVIEIHGSVFDPAYKILKQEGIPITLSPEAFLIASLIRTWLRRRGTGDERVDVRCELQDGVLRIRVKRIGNLH